MASEELKFYTHDWCPFAQRVWAFLEELEAPFEKIQISLPADSDYRYAFFSNTF